MQTHKTSNKIFSCSISHSVFRLRTPSLFVSLSLSFNRIFLRTQTKNSLHHKIMLLCLALYLLCLLLKICEPESTAEKKKKTHSHSRQHTELKFFIDINKVYIKMSNLSFDSHTFINDNFILFGICTIFFSNFICWFWWGFLFGIFLNNRVHKSHCFRPLSLSLARSMFVYVFHCALLCELHVQYSS